jgi:hypothetical protein
VTQSGATPVAIQQPFRLGDVRLYLATSTMVLGNVLLPYAVHRIPDGGRILLPIFFFTLIAGWRFGAKAGLLTGLLSPLANHVLTGMPPTPALQSIMLQSALLGVLASMVASRSRKLSLPLLALVVLVHQSLILVPQLLQVGMRPVLAAFELRLPGILLQIFGGFALLSFLGRHLPRPKRSPREG